MNVKISKSNRFKLDVQKIYKSFGLVKCTAINELVAFNNHGWTHISFDEKGHRRNRDNIFMRLKLVLHAPEVIQKASVIQDETINLNIKGNKRKIRFIELACGIQKSHSHVTVILRKIESGVLHFYSVRRTKNKIKKLLLKQKSP